MALPLAHEKTCTLAELVREPHERGLFDALLLLLTFAAGWTDATAYAELGHSFASFMSGNLLFFGLSLIRREGGLLLRTTVALVSFIAGAFACEVVLGRGPVRRTRRAWLGTLAACLGLDAMVLAGLAIASVATGGDPEAHPAAQVACLAIAAFAMGPVGILVGSLGVPGVVAGALTGTILQVAKRFAENVRRREPTHPLRTHVLLALCFNYVVAAVVFTVSRPWVGRVFVPAATLVVVVLLLLRSRARRLPACTTGPPR